MEDGVKNNLIKKLNQLQTNLDGFIKDVAILKTELNLLDETVVDKMKPTIDIIRQIIDEMKTMDIPTKMKIEKQLIDLILVSINNIIDPIEKNIGGFINLYKGAKKNYDLLGTYVLVNRIMEKKYNIKSLEESRDGMKKYIDKINEIIDGIEKTKGIVDGKIATLKDLLNRKYDGSHIDVVSKVFPLPFVNSKGFRIGDYKISVDTTNLPFTPIDQVNHYLYNLFDYSSYQGIPKMTRKDERDINTFFSHKKTELEAFKPIKYPDSKKEKYIQKEQELLKKENQKIRENMRKIQNELTEMGVIGDPAKREKIKQKIEAEIDEESKEGVDKKETILSEYLNAIDEVEHGSEGFTLPFLTSTGINKGKIVAGGKKKTRINKRKNKNIKDKRTIKRTTKRKR